MDLFDAKKAVATSLAEAEIRRERVSQDEKWGFPQRNTYCEWASILTGEVGELARELNDLHFGEGDREKMRAEATQVAAVALSILVHDRLDAITGREKPSAQQAVTVTITDNMTARKTVAMGLAMFGLTTAPDDLESQKLIATLMEVLDPEGYNAPAEG